ncbi:MAG: hypothetical protein HY952_02345 [Elusimicrobia bacterium]|nr:hypothetical protein [Elusimicrobiota bacterium]
MLKRLLALLCAIAAVPAAAQPDALHQLHSAAPAAYTETGFTAPEVQPSLPAGRWPTASHGYFDTALILGIKSDDASNDYYPFAGEVKVPVADPDGNQQQDEVLGLKGGMTTEAGHPGFFANGGDVKHYWERALKDYRNLDFVRAYYDIGIVAHLTQDQAVPAHAANINHVITFGDKFEKAIKKNLSLFAKLQGKVQAMMLPDLEPYAYYQPLQDDTRAHLAQWVNPSTKVPYWPAAGDAPPPGQDATKGSWSHYPAAGDTYDLGVSPEIMDRQMLQAAIYTYGVLKAAAKRLPPVTGGLSAERISSDKQAEVDLNFTAYDNRSGLLAATVSRPLYGYSKTLALKNSSDGRTIPSSQVSLRLPRPEAYQKGDDYVVVTLRDLDGNVSETRTKVRYEEPEPAY